MMICAGAPLSEEVLRRFEERFNKRLQDYYAMTECTPVFGPYAGQEVPRGSVGKLAPGAESRIVRPDGSECGVGEQGEILVRAAGMFKRYLNASPSMVSPLEGGLVKSGDLGHRDADGFFYVTGRAKDLIIRGGANISPSEVEAVLEGHAAVQQAAVVGAPDRIFGEVPVAFIVRRRGAAVTDQEMIAWAQLSLADFKVPRRFLFLDELPLGKTGKVDKALLRRNAAEGQS
jgi:long-chain acyl-CoA synthetase